ncbi:MAG: BrnT family toxin [Selenomonadaceae bacterium]|nr:BrnT family toxin [Selenomonadaceae bacterium]
MDVNFELGDYKFIWDSEKAEINFKKHKIKFENAALVFLDEYRIENYDDFNSDDEDRFKVVGEVEKILVVIYTEREDKTRIISARQATKFEREEYYEQFSFV